MSTSMPVAHVGGDDDAHFTARPRMRSRWFQQVAMQAVHVELCLRRCHEKVDHAPVFAKMIACPSSSRCMTRGSEAAGTTHVNEHHAHIWQVDFVFVGLHELGVAHEFRSGVDDLLREGRREQQGLLAGGHPLKDPQNVEEAHVKHTVGFVEMNIGFGQVDVATPWTPSRDQGADETPTPVSSCLACFSMSVPPYTVCMRSVSPWRFQFFQYLNGEFAGRRKHQRLQPSPGVARSIMGSPPAAVFRTGAVLMTSRPRRARGTVSR